MARAVAINVGANTNEPGFRGPIYPDGSFAFVPIPETEPTNEPVPRYGDLALPIDVSAVVDVPVHMDPEFADLGPCERYTYGDPWGVKARPLLDLEAGDHALFYATLDLHEGSAPGRHEVAEWIAPEWGAYLIGRFELARAPVPGERYPDLPDDVRAPFSNNAHVKRESFDAAVLLLGDTEKSRLYETAIPLSAMAGATPNRLVTEHSSDSGKGPWWRRPLRFDAAATEAVLALEDADDRDKAAVAVE